MKKYLIFVIVVSVSLLGIISCDDEDDSSPAIYGCTDPAATNYNPEATIDNGGCNYPVQGCTDSISINYNFFAEVDDGSCIYGGTGGNVTIVASPEHHGDPIVSSAFYPDSAFIQYNSQTFPGSSISDYDTIIVGQTGDDFVSIPGMKPGKYFIFMTCFDSSINQRVTGGTAIVMNQTSGQYDLIVFVTE